MSSAHTLLRCSSRRYAPFAPTATVASSVFRHEYKLKVVAGPSRIQTTFNQAAYSCSVTIQVLPHLSFHRRSESGVRVRFPIHGTFRNNEYTEPVDVQQCVLCIRIR